MAEDAKSVAFEGMSEEETAEAAEAFELFDQDGDGCAAPAPSRSPLDHRSLVRCPLPQPP
jgi:hypothetical protein